MRVAFQNHPFSGTSFVAKFQIPATHVPGTLLPSPPPSSSYPPAPTATTSCAGRMTWAGGGAVAQVRGHPVPGGAGGRSPFAAAAAGAGGVGGEEKGRGTPGRRLGRARGGGGSHQGPGGGGGGESGARGGAGRAAEAGARGPALLRLGCRLTRAAVGASSCAGAGNCAGLPEASASSGTDDTGVRGRGQPRVGCAVGAA